MIPILSVSILTLLAIGFIWDLSEDVSIMDRARDRWHRHWRETYFELSKYKRPRDAKGRFK